MSRIRGKNTKPELKFRSALFATGTRFRVHDRSVPGTPDVSHKGARVAVFIDGCFWHGCPQHYSRPASRQAYWDSRLAYNHDLRRRVKARLDGWKVMEIWECTLQRDAAAAARRAAAAIERRRLLK